MLVFLNVSKYSLTLLKEIFSFSYMEFNSTDIPKWPVRSGLFVSHLLSISIISDSNQGYFSTTGFHKSSSDKSSKSFCISQIQWVSKSSSIHNSALLQIIPFDSSHLIFLGSIVISNFGKYAPDKAVGT